jgi:mannose-1-phosphate guanylyltransferase/mannose-6-phosphate isomerase
MSVVFPVILCGGSGTRLWPLSRSDRPKQFITLTGNHTLLEGTLMRAAKIAGAKDPICVTAVAQAAAVRSSLERLGMRGQILLEPCARGTAPAIGAAALLAMRTDPEAIIVALPADHIIEDDTAFAASIGQAGAAASGSHIAVLGVTPRHAADGFGYILTGANLEGVPHVAWVTQFIEKPSGEAALGLIERGALWNAGIVVARASILIEAIGRHAPDVLAAVEQSLKLKDITGNEVALEAGAFAAAPSISFDTAVLEKSSAVVVAPLAAIWRDVGTWDAVTELFGGDLEGNRHHGRVRLTTSADSFVFSPHRLTVGLGLKGLVVVDTPDALLIASRSSLGDLRGVVAEMTADHIREVGANDLLSNPEERGASAGGIEVRRIVLDPGQSEVCVPQRNISRHWIVLEGRVEVTTSNTTASVGAQESFHVEPGEPCEYSNSGTFPSKLLELRIDNQAVP